MEVNLKLRSRAAERERPAIMPDTINTRSMVIEEGPLLPKFVRFESEPWTSFHMAGEIIRELRKALENKQGSLPAPKNDMRKAA